MFPVAHRSILHEIWVMPGRSRSQDVLPSWRENHPLRPHRLEVASDETTTGFQVGHDVFEVVRADFGGRVADADLRAQPP